MEFIYISISVLRCYGDVYNVICLAVFVDCVGVWSERPIKARYHLVDSNSGGGRNINCPQQSVLDGAVALCCGCEI